VSECVRKEEKKTNLGDELYVMENEGKKRKED